MSMPECLLVAAGPLLLLSFGAIPNWVADRRSQAMKMATVVTAALTLLLSATSIAWIAQHGAIDQAAWSISGPLPLSLGVYFDSLAAVMMAMITFLGLIVLRYSVCYLEGEAHQGRFLKWMAFTLGAVLWLVISRNLVMLTAAWMLTSFGLHQLLTHYENRLRAIWAARKKFLISRLGDAFLLVALGLTFWRFGSTEYSVVFAAADTLRTMPDGGGWMISLIGTLFVLGAMTKSAQVPFHSWLPDTMETPTPVSALMHAGIINAGGFLVIRLSPLVTLSPLALDVLALIGAATALVGGVVMLTQPSVKRGLAYSTIAQMGFMMLQCGLGAFSAALLHIVAHSCYKAHAFLSAGSVLESADRTAGIVLDRPKATWLPAALIAALAIAGGWVWLLGIHLEAKPGAAVLSIILVAALTHLIWSATATQSWPVLGRALLAATGAAAVYYLGYLGMDAVLSSSVSYKSLPVSWPGTVTMSLMAIAVLGVFLLQTYATSVWRWSLLRSLYVHAFHGFYLDIPAQRLTARFWQQSVPVQ
jgi:NAD(P)H-quinone oxidoreductase subunit 5